MSRAAAIEARAAARVGLADARVGSNEQGIGPITIVIVLVVGYFAYGVFKILTGQKPPS